MSSPTGGNLSATWSIRWSGRVLAMTITHGKCKCDWYLQTETIVLTNMDYELIITQTEILVMEGSGEWWLLNILLIDPRHVILTECLWETFSVFGTQNDMIFIPVMWPWPPMVLQLSYHIELFIDASSIRWFGLSVHLARIRFDGPTTTYFMLRYVHNILHVEICA